MTINEQEQRARLDAALKLRQAMGSLKSVGMLMSEAVDTLIRTNDDASQTIEQMIETMGRSLNNMRYAQSRLEDCNA